MSNYVLGVDYGSDSVRTVLVNTENGNEMSSSVFYYPRWKKGMYCIPAKNQFRQHPLDYLEGLENTIKDCIVKAGGSAIAANIKGIAIDTTGSTPVMVNESGTPLALVPGFEENPNAMFILWKDHTSVQEAAEINQHALNFETNYLKYVGGIYSSEWFWAKMLHVLRADDDVAKAGFSCVEHCDWIPFVLTGGTRVTEMKRSRCAAGHKALWAEEFGGLPPLDFFAGLSPLLIKVAGNMFTETYTSDIPAGNLCPEWAVKLGLSTNVVVGVGAFDAHMGAVGGQIEPYYLSRIMGTSTCDILVAPPEDLDNKLIKGICGQVNGSVIPGTIGLEAGQSAFGDTYAWFKNLLSWPLQNIVAKSNLLPVAQLNELVAEAEHKIIAELSNQAAALPLTDADELAIDWFNGRRTPDANQELKGAIFNIALGSDAPRIFRALVAATCFGARSIVERFISEGIAVKGVIGLGGVAKKSPYIMQMLADVLNMSIRIHKSDQTCAMGAAMFAAVVAGLHPDVNSAMKAMGSGFDAEYLPNTALTEYYNRQYEVYKKTGAFIENNKNN